MAVVEIISNEVIGLQSLFYSILTLRLVRNYNPGSVSRLPSPLSSFALLIALLVSVMFYEVIVRYVFEKPTLWANELSLWIAGFIFLFSGLYAMQQRSHIRIFLLYDVLPRPLQKLCDIISTGLIVVFAAALYYGAYGEAAAKFLRWETFGTAFDPPIPATMKPLILVAISLVALQAVSNLIMDWNKAPEHHSPADEIDAEEIAVIKRTLGSDS